MVGDGDGTGQSLAAARGSEATSGRDARPGSAAYSSEEQRSATKEATTVGAPPPNLPTMGAQYKIDPHEKVWLVRAPGVKVAVTAINCGVSDTRSDNQQSQFGSEGDSLCKARVA